MRDDWYLAVGARIGAIASVCVFLFAWGYCIATAGFLVGVGFGWIPALICAYFTLYIVSYAWGLIAFLGALILLPILFHP